MLRLLRQRNLALLWAGGLISLVGDWVLLTTLPYYVYQLTNSLLALAAMTVIQLVPFVVLGSVAGVFVDRWDRKATLVICNLIQACTLPLLLLVHSTTSLWVAYAVVGAQATVSNFIAPAEYALLPKLVAEEELTTANSLLGLNNQLARLLGPPLGGVLLAWFGINPVVMVDSVSFLVVAGMLVSLKHGMLASYEQRATSEARSASTVKQAWARFWSEWAQGWEFMRQRPQLMHLMLTIGIMTFGGTMIDPLYPAFIKDILHVDPIGFGWIRTAQVAGGIIGGLIVGQIGGKLPAARLLAWGNILVGVLLLIQYNVPIFPVTIVVVLLIGPEQVATGVALQTLLQTSVDNRYQGRIFGIVGTMGALCSMLGGGTAGPLGERVGIVAALDVAALCTLLAAGVAFVTVPRTKHPPSHPKRAIL